MSPTSIHGHNISPHSVFAISHPFDLIKSSTHCSTIVMHPIGRMPVERQHWVDLMRISSMISPSIEWIGMNHWNLSFIHFHRCSIRVHSMINRVHQSISFDLPPHRMVYVLHSMRKCGIAQIVFCGQLGSTGVMEYFPWVSTYIAIKIFLN